VQVHPKSTPPANFYHFKDTARSFDSLADARCKLAFWCYDYNHVRPHSLLGSKTPAEARRALELFEGNAPGVLATPETENYQLLCPLETGPFETGVCS
jgi:hypothetical protein